MTSLCLVCGKETKGSDHRRLVSSPTNSFIIPVWKSLLQAKGATNEYLFDGSNGGFMCRKCWKNITSFHKLRESLLHDLDGVIAALPIPSEMQEQAAASTVQVGKHPHASTAEDDVSFLAKRPRLAAHGQQPVFIAESSSPGVQVNMTCS